MAGPSDIIPDSQSDVPFDIIGDVPVKGLTQLSWNHRNFKTVYMLAAENRFVSAQRPWAKQSGMLSGARIYHQTGSH
jgi:hypothetical protein